MADISKCSGVGCPKKEKCYRYTAPGSYYQSYFTYPPMEVIKGKWSCGYFWKI